MIIASAYRVPCPRCGSGPGERCTDLRANGPNSGSKDLKHPHKARNDQARRDNRR